jgi:F0F1-type ATP synthase assembly protein I
MIEEKDKFTKLQNRINALRNANKTNNIKPANNNSAPNIAIEVVAGVIVGLIIGLFFDNVFDSKPLFLIICLILSMIASFKSIWNKYSK